MHITILAMKSQSFLRYDANFCEEFLEIYQFMKIKVIRQNGSIDLDGVLFIQFGTLFEIYNKISNKLVGLLLRARKHGLVDFHGEMLFQRRDDFVKIRLLDKI